MNDQRDTAPKEGHLEMFAVSSPGLERITAQELSHLGCLPDVLGEINASLERSHRLEGGVPFTGDLEKLYLANLHLRTASRVLVRLGEFRAVAFYELRKKAARLPWERFIHPGQAVSLRVTCRKSRLYHSDAVAERILGAISDRLNSSSPAVPFDEDLATEEVQLVVVRFLHDICTISIDSSGSGLHRRGYRQAVAKAPLRETLAAGMLLASGWDSAAPMIDPFCGSGTIAIEAALLASGTPPGWQRKFAFMNWPVYAPEVWEKIHLPVTPVAPPTQPILLGSDRDAGAIKMAQANADRAGVSEWIEFKQQAFSAIAPVGQGWVITNLPYGVRVSSAHDLRNLYAHLGDVLRQRCSGWNYAILSNDDQLLAQLRLLQASRLSLVNGGLPVILAMGKIAEMNPGGKNHAG